MVEGRRRQATKEVALSEGATKKVRLRVGGGGVRTWSTMWPMTPFCPWRDENLSPSSGRRVERTRIFIRYLRSRAGQQDGALAACQPSRATNDAPSRGTRAIAQRMGRQSSNSSDAAAKSSKAQRSAAERAPFLLVVGYHDAVDVRVAVAERPFVREG